MPKCLVIKLDKKKISIKYEYQDQSYAKTKPKMVVGYDQDLQLMGHV